MAKTSKEIGHVSSCLRRLGVERLERRDLLSISMGAQFGGINENMASWYPLQINAAAGPNYVVDVAGGDVAIFSHSGQLIENKPITNFTGGSGDNPTVVYDPTVAGGGRYIICSGVSTVYFGISNTSDPTQGWHSYTLSFPSSGDGGRFGFNNSAYFVWYSAGGNPNTIVIQKSSILTAGGSMVSYSQNSPGHPTLQVDDTATYGTGTSDPAWFYSTTQLIKETNYLSASPTYTTFNITGGTFASAKYAEIRTVGGVQTIAGVSDNASITWAVNGVTSLYWSEVNVATAAVIQSGNIATPSGWTDMGYAYSSLAPNGDIGITFMDATASGSEMGMFVTGRKYADPAGTMNTPVAVFIGTYDFTRVGDYGTVNADPTDNTFWATEYSDSDPGYTAISNFGLTPTPAAVMQPVMGFGAAPSDGTNVNLQWNAVPGATSYQIERSSDGVTYTTVASGLAGTSFTDTPGGNVSGLYYEILAFNGQTDSAAPSPIQVTLAATQAYNGLSAPTGLAASLAATGTGVSLSWNNVASGSGYFVWRATSGAAWTQIATITSAGTTTYSDSGLAGGQLYYYRVSTRDSGGGQSTPSAVMTITNRPSAPTVSVSTGWSNQLQVAWNLIPSATSYTVLRSPDGSNYTAIGTTAADYVTYTDFTVSPNTKYYYEVIANNPLGNSSAGTASATSYLPTPAGLTLTQGAGPLVLQWTAVTGATGYQIQRSTDNTNFSPIATTTAANYTDTSVVPSTPYYYRVYAVSSVNGNTSSPATAFSAAPPVAPLPYLWQSQDISVSNTGASGYAAGVYTVNGYGSDIWNASDFFHFTYLPLTGDGTITAKVLTQANTGSSAKAGVMVRASLAANSAYAFAEMIPGGGTAFQYRTTAGGGAAQAGTSSGSAPYWVQLVRSGNSFTAKVSSDGSTWTTVATHTITMTGTVYIGLAVDSNWNTYSKLIDNLPPDSTPAISTTTFSNVVVTTPTLQPPTVAAAASASPNPVTGTTANFSVLGGDATGQSNLYYTWTATSLPGGSAQPTFSTNGTNAAQNTTATFNRAGAYTLQATITNTYGLSVTSSVNVTVNQTLSGITISPTTAIVNVSSTQQFTAYGADQFDQPIPGPISATWSISPTSGAGSINSSGGLYTAPSTQATATITAASGGNTATSAVQVFNRDLFTNTAGGSWTTAGNWQNSTIASGAGVAADFSTLGLASAPTVTLDGARTVGDLLFGDTNNGFGWMLNTGTGGPLTLSTTSGTPTIVVTNESATIGAALAGTQGITKTGTGTLTLTASNNYSGATTISGGNLVATGGGWFTTRSIGSGSLVINAGATAEFTVAHGFGYGNGGEPATVNGGTLIFDNENYVSSLSMTGGTLQGAGETRPAGNLTITVNASPTTSTISNPTNLSYGNINFSVASGTTATGLLVSGLISGGDNITKSGAGVAVFSNANSYTGTTTISAGTLWANNTVGWAIGSGTVAVNTGGTLGGTGAVAGPVTVNNGGTLAPGAGGIGTLTINNTLALHGTTAMEISKGGGTPSADLIAGVTTLTYGGTLTVTNLAGTLAAGDSFTLFSAGSYSSSFSTINLPALGSNLAWDTSALASNGTIKIYGPPSVATPAAALQSGNKTIALSTLGSDLTGESNLTYTWTSSPATGVTFSPNGTNASKNSTATLSAAGMYTFTVTITNAHNLSVTSVASITVGQTLTSVVVSPATASITAGSTQQFSATAYDQFGAAITGQSFTWAVVTGAGSVNATGLYTPPYAPAAATVQAADNGMMSNTALMSVTGQAQWNAPANASWNAASSWKDSISGTTIAAPGVRSIAGDTVLFAAAIGGTASLDGANPALAGITFNNAATSYTIAQGSGGTITMQGAAAVNLLAGNHAITAPLVLADDSEFDESTGTKLTVGGNISGGGSFTKSGAGVVELSGVNSFGGGTIVVGGKLIVDNPNSLPEGGSLTIGSSAYFSAPMSAGPVALVSPQVASASASVPAAIIPPTPDTPVFVKAAIARATVLNQVESTAIARASTAALFLYRIGPLNADSSGQDFSFDRSARIRDAIFLEYGRD